MNRFFRKQPTVAPTERVNWSYCQGGASGELVHFFLPGSPGHRHVITLVVASLKKKGVQLLTVQDEGHMCLRSYCHDYLVIDQTLPIRAGKAAQITLNCYEDPENVVSLTVWGYTEEERPTE
jgi:hypothetical protein